MGKEPSQTLMGIAGQECSIMEQVQGLLINCKSMTSNRIQHVRLLLGPVGPCPEVSLLQQAQPGIAGALSV